MNKALQSFTMAAMSLALAFHPLETEAGSRSDPADLFEPAIVAEFGIQVEKLLAERGAYVGIVARTGRPREELPDGVRYTHVGLWVYSNLSLEDGRTIKGYAVHNLYQNPDNHDVSQLFQDYPTDFFSAAYAMEAGIAIPTPALQAKLLDVLADGRWQDMHNPRYSVISNPADPSYQNCTEHILDVLMAAIYDTADRGRIKANIAAYFTPTPIPVSPWKRALGPVFAAGVETDDHENGIATATFGAIASFLKTYHLADDVLVLNLSGDIEPF